MGTKGGNVGFVAAEANCFLTPAAALCLTHLRNEPRAPVTRSELKNCPALTRLHGSIPHGLMSLLSTRQGKALGRKYNVCKLYSLSVAPQTSAMTAQHTGLKEFHKNPSGFQFIIRGGSRCWSTVNIKTHTMKQKHAFISPGLQQRTATLDHEPLATAGAFDNISSQDFPLLPFFVK